MLVRVFLPIISFLFICFLSCGGFSLAGGDYSFSDTAAFYAPKSKVSVIIFSNGYVPKDADLGNGKGLARMTFLNYQNDTILLLTSAENIDTIILRNKTIPFSCDRMNKSRLFSFLDSAGFRHLDENEISEMRDAITSINYGHKGGFTKNQTKYIEVKEIRQHESY